MRVLVETESILSFNSADFKRYDLVTALHPASLLA
jgi:hypothetical protein